MWKHLCFLFTVWFNEVMLMLCALPRQVGVRWCKLFTCGRIGIGFALETCRLLWVHRILWFFSNHLPTKILWCARILPRDWCESSFSMVKGSVGPHRSRWPKDAFLDCCSHGLLNGFSTNSICDFLKNKRRLNREFRARNEWGRTLFWHLWIYNLQS